MGEFEDQYTAELEGEVKETRGALVNDTITVLSPASSAVGARARQVVAQAITWDIVARQWLEGISQALGR